MYHFFIIFLCLFFWCFLTYLACKGLQNGCPNRSGYQENGALAAIFAELQEKVRFWTLFGWFFHLFFNNFCAVFAAGFRDILSILEKRRYQTQTGKPMVLRVK